MKNEDTERNKLGDLPDDIARERGEFGTIDDSLGNIPADMRRAAQTRQAARDAGIGGPSLDYNVRGIFDSRPINGNDFHQVVSVDFVEDVVARVAAFQVPQGRVIVLREIRFFEPMGEGGGVLPDNLNVADIFVQLTRNGGVIDPLNMEPQGGTIDCDYIRNIPIKGGDTLSTFQIFDEGEIIGFIGTPNISDDFAMYVQFYGNLLVKTGVSANFEVANKGAGGATKVAASQADLRSAPPVRVRRQRRF